MPININITFTFMHISRLILASKSTSFTFSYEYSLKSSHFYMEDLCTFTYFFYCKMMCGCRLITCLYDIRQTSYERRFHHGYVAPSVPIWAKFAPILGKYIPTADSSRYTCPKPRRTAAIIYRHILLGEKFVWPNPHMHTWENTTRFFSRRASICTVYCWEKCKKL